MTSTNSGPQFYIVCSLPIVKGTFERGWKPSGYISLKQVRPMVKKIKKLLHRIPFSQCVVSFFDAQKATVQLLRRNSLPRFHAEIGPGRVELWKYLWIPELNTITQYHEKAPDLLEERGQTFLSFLDTMKAGMRAKQNVLICTEPLIVEALICYAKGDWTTPRNLTNGDVVILTFDTAKSGADVEIHRLGEM